jgi:hypothetical protein
MSKMLLTFVNQKLKIMSKKKKKRQKAPAVVKPKGRNRLFPVSYIRDVAEKIAPSPDMIPVVVNTLTDFAKELLTKGYLWRISDAKLFKAKREKTLAADWDKQKTLIDDIIHNKNS